MPHRSPEEKEEHESIGSRQDKGPSVWGRTWHKVESWLKKDEQGDEDKYPEDVGKETVEPGIIQESVQRPNFARKNSDMRELLCPHEPDVEERRARSVDRRGKSYPRALSLCRSSLEHSRSVPDIPTPNESKVAVGGEQEPASQKTETPNQIGNLLDDPAAGVGMQRATSGSIRSEAISEVLDRGQLQAEIDAKWILNLSMFYKDRSDREKFFFTYAQEPNKWRRVTISCDYRNLSQNTIEAEIKNLHYQRDKSCKIYEVLRDSLLQIQFYPTVTNIKLQTVDGRLHLHVSEDRSEIIQYPPISRVRHIDCPRYKESLVLFENHLSGFVYRVQISGRALVKKEIPGPDSVHEFLYEINALSSLRHSSNVVELVGLVVDETETSITGLLLSFASQGALVDLIYEYRASGQAISWPLRERWARQIVNGLEEIHEAGFVQGDFTLSNIVVDAKDNAIIIDINRRGCPVGWEPDELRAIINSGQSPNMFIGTKTDLYQLGIVLWGLAMQNDEPERERPLPPIDNEEIPDYFKEIVTICLSDRPQDRLSAKELLHKFPKPLPQITCSSDGLSTVSASMQRPHKEYIDPETAVNLDDISNLAQRPDAGARSQLSILSSGATFADATTSSDYVLDSCDSCLVSHNRNTGSAFHGPQDKKRRGSDTSIELEEVPFDPDQKDSLINVGIPELDVILAPMVPEDDQSMSKGQSETIDKEFLGSVLPKSTQSSARRQANS